MSFAELLFVIVALATGLIVLIGALVAHRVLGNVGAGLRELDQRLADRSLVIPDRLESARASLENAYVVAERALWTLGNADDRMDRLTTDLTAKRAVSDSLRVRLIEGQLSLARGREFIKLLMRLDKLRRELG